MANQITDWQDRFHATKGPLPGVASALALGRRAVKQFTEAGRATYKSPAQFDASFSRAGFRLVENIASGPVHADARQLIYRSSDGMVLLKVKTMGYGNGQRSGGTMSIEIAVGGFEWKHVICKLDVEGQPFPTNFITPDKLVRTPLGLRVRRANGNIEEVMAPELVLDPNSPINADYCADRTHFDFAAGFDPRGAAGLRMIWQG